jgi:hypothetical protein
MNISQHFSLAGLHIMCYIFLGIVRGSRIMLIRNCIFFFPCYLLSGRISSQLQEVAVAVSKVVVLDRRRGHVNPYAVPVRVVLYVVVLRRTIISSLPVKK